MSFVITNPEALTVAATEVRRIRDRAIQSDAQVAPMTTAVRPPAADLVSEKAATFLVEYARKYRQTIAAAAVVLEEFAHALTTGADKYATAEADNIKYSRHEPTEQRTNRCISKRTHRRSTPPTYMPAPVLTRCWLPPGRGGRWMWK